MMTEECSHSKGRNVHTILFTLYKGSASACLSPVQEEVIVTPLPVVEEQLVAGFDILRGGGGRRLYQSGRGGKVRPMSQLAMQDACTAVYPNNQEW